MPSLLLLEVAITKKQFHHWDLCQHMPLPHLNPMATGDWKVDEVPSSSPLGRAPLSCFTFSVSVAKKERKKKEKREKSVIIAQSCDHESTTRRCKDEVAVGRLFIHGCQEISALTVGGAAVRIGERVLHCSAVTERQMFLIRSSYAIANSYCKDS